jgi:hypothetical protein
LSFAISAFGAPSGFLFGFSRRWRRQGNTRASRLAQANCDRLLRRARAVLASSHVLDFLMHEFTGCGSRRLASTKILFRALNRGSGWHTRLLLIRFALLAMPIRA